MLFKRSRRDYEVVNIVERPRLQFAAENILHQFADSGGRVHNPIAIRWNINAPRPVTANAVFRCDSSSSGIWKNASDRSIADRYWVPFSRPSIRSTFGCGYAFFIVASFNLRASMHSLIFPLAFRTAIIGFNHVGLSTFLMIPRANIRLISAVIPSCMYGETQT